MRRRIRRVVLAFWAWCVARVRLGCVSVGCLASKPVIQSDALEPRHPTLTHPSLTLATHHAQNANTTRRIRRRTDDHHRRAASYHRHAPAVSTPAVHQV